MDSACNEFVLEKPIHSKGEAASAWDNIEKVIDECADKYPILGASKRSSKKKDILSKTDKIKHITTIDEALCEGNYELQDTPQSCTQTQYCRPPALRSLPARLSRLLMKASLTLSIIAAGYFTYPQIRDGLSKAFVKQAHASTLADTYDGIRYYYDCRGESLKKVSIKVYGTDKFWRDIKEHGLANGARISKKNTCRGRLFIPYIDKIEHFEYVTEVLPEGYYKRYGIE